MGVDPARALSTLRLSLSCLTTDAEIEAALEIIPRVVARLRRLGARRS
jgi:cysteine desulfurase